MENSRNKQFIIFKLHAVLSSMMKSPAVLLCPTRHMNNPFVQRIHTVYTTPPLQEETVYRVFGIVSSFSTHWESWNVSLMDKEGTPVHFKLIFVPGVGKGRGSFSPYGYPFIPVPLTEKIILPPVLWKSIVYIQVGLFLDSVLFYWSICLCFHQYTLS